jgi:pimeloyl-ACP methyl ester carboxylesterase
MFRSSLLPCLLLITFRCYTQNNSPADTGAYFKSFDSTKIYYEVRGTGDAVVLVHGFIVNGQSWKRTELYKNLLEEGYKVIILDQRGNGFSDKPHTPEAYENDAEAKDIMALMKKLKIKSTAQLAIHEARSLFQGY